MCAPYVEARPKGGARAEKEIGENQNLGDKDQLYQQAIEIIRSEVKASTSF